MTLILKSTGLTAEFKDGSGGAVYKGVKKIKYKPKTKQELEALKAARGKAKKPAPKKRAPYKRKLDPGILRRCMFLIYDEPSGLTLTEYLEKRFKTQSTRDHYFETAERLVWQECDPDFLEEIKERGAAKLDAQVVAVEEALKRIEEARA
jgi:hypothetical protein